MEQFLSNLWINIKAAYVKVRAFTVKCLMKTGALQYGMKLVDEFDHKKDRGFVDYLKAAIGYAIPVVVGAIYGFVVGALSYFLTSAVVFVFGPVIGLVAAFAIAVGRILFIFDVADMLFWELLREEASVGLKEAVNADVTLDQAFAAA